MTADASCRQAMGEVCSGPIRMLSWRRGYADLGADSECMGTRCIRFSGSCLAASQAGEIFEWAADSVDSDGPPVLPRRVTFAGESIRSPVSWVDLRTAGFASLALTSTGQLWSWTAFQLGEQTPDMFGGQVRNQKYTHRALSMCHDSGFVGFRS